MTSKARILEAACYWLESQLLANYCSALSKLLNLSELLDEQLHPGSHKLWKMKTSQKKWGSRAAIRIWVPTLSSQAACSDHSVPQPAHPEYLTWNKKASTLSDKKSGKLWHKKARSGSLFTPRFHHPCSSSPCYSLITSLHLHAGAWSLGQARGSWSRQGNTNFLSSGAKRPRTWRLNICLPQATLLINGHSSTN